MTHKQISPKNQLITNALWVALGMVALPSVSHAWDYLTDYNNTNGRPNGMTDSSALIPGDIVGRVNTLLGAEGKDISKNPETQALLTDDLGGNIFLTKSAKVKVAFLNEGAGYQNSIGFFKFKKEDLPKPSISDEKIMFPNASTPHLKMGDTVDLGTYSAGDAIGFTLVANGWNSSDGTVKNRPATAIFRTIKELNPEPAPKNAHTVLLSSPEDKLLVLSMEDLNRESKSYNDYGYSSDEDFNDIILAIIVDPFDAVDITHTPGIDPGETHSKPLGLSGRLNWREKADVQTESSSTGTETKSEAQQ